MSSTNPRRTAPVTRSDSAAHGLSLITNMVLRKGATFHSPSSPSSSDPTAFRPAPQLRRSQTNLDDVVDAHRRRVALTLGNIDKTLSASKDSASPSSSSRRALRDTSISVPRGILDHTIMTAHPDTDRRVLRPRANRRPSRLQESDSGLGTSIASSDKPNTPKRENLVAGSASRKGKTSAKPSAITRSAAAPSADNLPGLSAKATSRIYEHTLKPLLAKPSLKAFHPLVLECPQKILNKEIVCLRDLEKTLLLIAPERTKVAELYLEFCITSVRCIQATVEYLSDREQTRPSDAPYSSGYFIDLVEQIRQYARQLADARDKATSDDHDEMDVDGSDEIKLHGGITVNGRPAELVRIRKDGKAVSIATGKPVELEEDAKGPVRVKRSASQELEDEEEIMRSMARRKKNAPPEMYAPKQCPEPGCGRMFNRPCDLTKHEKTHSRPWKCPDPACSYHNKGWPTEKERDRHINDKHSANPPMYECLEPTCSYKSKRESNCKQHMEKSHGWTYVRTKTNGKKRAEKADSTALPTPLLQNMSTPATTDPSVGVATPPQDQFLPLYTNHIEFPTYLPDDHFNLDLPQQIDIEYSPVDNGTPSTDSGLDHNSTYQEMGPEFSVYEDIYAANAQLPTPIQNPYGSKEMVPNFMPFSTAELCQTHPAPHISPTGQGNAMLFTPASLAEMDEGFEDFPGTTHGGADFILFPPTEISKPASFEGLFDEIPSLAAGYSQPNSQNLPLMDWQSAEYSGYSQH